jgi:glycosyltransferase involved in cell wall biosynthesis
MTKISLCLLVWNQVEGCRADVPNLPRDAFDEVYAIDGGSADGTVQYLESQNIPVYRQPKPGLNAAYVHAVEKSGCDAVVVFFPKGTLSPTILLSFRPLLESGYDLVIASRNISGAANEEDNKLIRPRKWAVLCLAALAAVLWKREGYFVRDVLHGVKGFTKTAFKEMRVSDHGISIDIEMVIRSYRLRMKRTEFPVSETSQPFNETHFKMLPTGMRLVKYLITEVRRGN